MLLPEGVIFDMDGLIFDTERLFMNEKNRILLEYGYPARESDYIQTLGLGGAALNEKLAALYGPSYPADEITERTRMRVTAHIRAHGPTVKPGIRTLLVQLRELGIPCCVATSTPGPIAAEYLALAELDSYFARVLGGEAVTHSKPAPDLFLAACACLAAEPAHALVLEDSENGILAAAAAGIPVICIPDLKQPDPRIAERAAAVLHSADEVIGLLSA